VCSRCRLALTTATQYDLPRGDLELPAEVVQSTAAAAAAPNSAVDVALPSPTSAEAAETTATPAVSSVPRRRLATLLVDAAFPTDSISATRALFQLWNATYEPSRGTACSQAVMQDLQCLFLSRGSLGELRTLNRPSILTLVDANGDKHQVVVSRLDYDTADLATENGSERVDIVDLTHYWYGETLLLWKPLLATPEDLAPGSRSESVPWLRDALQRIFGATILGDDPLYYDEQLAERVREFQRGNRLTIDGVVGAQTQMAMQTALGEPGIPLLSEAD